MFRKGAKSNEKPRERRGNDLANMLGIGNSMMPEDDDDESLEAELAAIQGRPVPKKRRDPKNEKLMSLDQITKLADDSMKDVDDNISDEDLENDDELMGELNDIIGDEDEEEDDSESHELPSKVPTPDSGSAKILEERKKMYIIAIDSAKAEGSSSKARRYDRGLKEIENLLKQARAGKAVKEDDIPPPVVVKGGCQSPSQDPSKAALDSGDPAAGGAVEGVKLAAPPAPSPPALLIDLGTTEVKAPSSQVDNEQLAMLTRRRDEYKQAALQKKREGDMPSAKQLLGISKRFDTVISSVEKGENVNLDDVPPPPSQLLAKASSAVEAKRVEAAQAEDNIPDPSGGVEEQPGPSREPVTAPTDATPAAPSSVLEALQQRLEKYNQASEQAKAEGNGSKARRMGRIVKQYQDAIKAHKAGRPFDVEELPIPPGFPPFPGSRSASSQAPQATPTSNVASAVTPEPQPAPTESQRSSDASNERPAPAIKSSSTLSRNEKELQFLLQRQKEFKEEALKAKRDGNIEAAKNYLRQAKGLEPMIESAQNGLRVDITTVPKCEPFGQGEAPTTTDENEEFEFLSTDDLQRNDSLGDRNEVYARLEQALKNQIETSQKNVSHYKLLGDLTTAQNFLALQKSSQQDLDTLKVSKAHGDPVPKFHYENKTFPIVRSHPNLSDSEAEITIMRCINIPLPQGYQPKDMYVYVTCEFPFPSDSPQTGCTETVKQTINPEYNKTFKVTIDRKSRALQRIFRRQGVNFTVMYNRGFLKSDKALGQASVKLEKFMNKCKVHECVDLMDPEKGRKAVGGKIEVMIKLREPLVDKDAEVVEERWLVLDTHLRSFQMRAKSAYGVQRPNIQESYESLEVYKLDKEIAEKKIAAFKSQGKSPPAKVAEELKSVDTNMKELHKRLTSGGMSGMRDYLKQLEGGLDIEKKKAQNFLKAGDKTNAKLCLARKKLLDKEIDALNQRIR